jgi:hypothetical protein
MKKRISIAVALIAALAMVMTMSISVFAGGIGSNEAALKTDRPGIPRSVWDAGT